MLQKGSFVSLQVNWKFRHACVMESIHLFTCLCISPGAYNLGCLYMRMYRGAKNSDLSEAAAFKAKAVDSFLLAARLGDMWVSGGTGYNTARFFFFFF